MNKPVLTFWGVLVLFVLAGCQSALPHGFRSAQPGPTGPIKTTSAPLSWSTVGTPQTQVIWAGKAWTFWIDTGAGLTCIREDLARRAGWTPSEEARVQVGTGSVPVWGYRATLDQVTLGETTVTSVEALVLPEAQLTVPLFGFLPWVRIDGILGANLLKQGTWTLDKTTSKVTWGPTDSTRQGSLIWNRYPVVPDDQGRLIGWDSGANRSVLSNQATKGSDHWEWRGDAGGASWRPVGKVSQVTLTWAGSVWTWNELNTTELPEGIFARLGSDLFRQAPRVSWDAQARWMEWTR